MVHRMYLQIQVGELLIYNLIPEQIVDQQLPNLDLQVHPVNHDQIVEIDSVAELKAIDPSYADVEC